ncbi:hypothetical protein PGTUg99_017482 [Puccinia graminis f. sp. tritici]|uniref:Uncharacterized protein n=2 Tax=Puccinia graminis f. sp. tritici TaxID=56615 RepID=A0A5B0MIA6_PUCGR|nr:hypothetical protein PGTUg99_017482 [Puccinia graminis f. sp. tritici]
MLKMGNMWRLGLVIISMLEHHFLQAIDPHKLYFIEDQPNKLKKEENPFNKNHPRGLFQPEELSLGGTDGKPKTLNLFDDLLVPKINQGRDKESYIVQHSGENAGDQSFPPAPKKLKLDLKLSLGLPNVDQNSFHLFHPQVSQSEGFHLSGSTQPTSTYPANCNHASTSLQQEIQNPISYNRFMDKYKLDQINPSRTSRRMSDPNFLIEAKMGFDESVQDWIQIRIP